MSLYRRVAGRVRLPHGGVFRIRRSAAIETLSGDTLTASLRDGSVILTDENGGVATVTQADILQSNGVIHVTDAVSLPQ
ncbi:MAG: fasciclin domain-containing protein [Brevundimonas sp.]|uniref:fasciclin domain-containing protein n=1 Tax=Brevundimonas sp. TaxID=1871086 RepID=UPI0030016BDC